MDRIGGRHVAERTLLYVIVRPFVSLLEPNFSIQQQRQRRNKKLPPNLKYEFFFGCIALRIRTLRQYSLKSAGRPVGICLIEIGISLNAEVEIMRLPARSGIESFVLGKKIAIQKKLAKRTLANKAMAENALLRAMPAS